MKILIIYATKTGSSKEAAEMLADNMKKHAEITLLNINDNPPVPDGFDAVVIGGSIRFGKLNSKLKKYIKKYKDVISSMASALFICCGIAKDFEDYVTMQIPRNLNCSFGIHYFGGHLKPDRAKGIFDKILIKTMRESILMQDPDTSDYYRHELPELMPDTIRALAERILKNVK